MKWNSLTSDGNLKTNEIFKISFRAWVLCGLVQFTSTVNMDVKCIVLNRGVFDLHDTTLGSIPSTTTKGKFEVICKNLKLLDVVNLLKAKKLLIFF